MKRNEWLIVFVPLLAVWYLDRITKGWAIDLTSVISHGYLHFVLRRNPGAMLGLFSELPAFLRIVSLSTGGAFLVVIYALIQYLLPIKSLILRSGLSVLLGGILGNVTDRILWGNVVDFIFIGEEGKFLSPVFNVADALQWFGYLMIIYAITRDGGILWPENNARKKYWVNLKFQLKYCYVLLGIGFSVSLICAVFSYTYLRVALIELVGPNPVVLNRFLGPFAVTFAVVCIACGIALFAVGKIISHKVAGPIYSFEKFVVELLDGTAEASPTVRKFKLRTHDEFKELEAIANNLQNKLLPSSRAKPEAPSVAETTDPIILTKPDSA